jgi:hypothetical protein
MSKDRNRSNKNDGMVSLAELERELAASRTAIRRWLREAGIPALVMGNGRNASIRYRAGDVEKWIASRETIS